MHSLWQFFFRFLGTYLNLLKKGSRSRSFSDHLQKKDLLRSQIKGSGLEIEPNTLENVTTILCTVLHVFSLINTILFRLQIHSVFLATFSYRCHPSDTAHIQLLYSSVHRAFSMQFLRYDFTMIWCPLTNSRSHGKENVFQWFSTWILSFSTGKFDF